MSISLPIVFPVTSHTDFVGIGSTFVAIKGLRHDGAQFLAKAIKQGATTLIVDHKAIVSASDLALIRSNNIALVYVANPRKALAQLSAKAAGNPAKKLTIIGVTGTNGKTTTTFILKHILQSAGYKTALLSSVANQIEDQAIAVQLKADGQFTTAQSDYLHQFLKLCVENNVTHVVMEVAAQAVTMHRVEGIAFDGIVFTNFGLEHLEFYASMDDYFAAKCQLIKQCKAGAPLIASLDQEKTASLVNYYDHVITTSTQQKADFIITINGVSPQIDFSIMGQHNIHHFNCPALIGPFNVENAVKAIIMALHLGVDAVAIQQALTTFAGVPGRMQKSRLPNGALCIIDYAYGPPSYQALLPVLRKLTDHLIVIFGAGGDRDPSRRPLMGALASHYADLVILTNDNPRSEDPDKIIADIVRGITAQDASKVLIELDREEAIKIAYGKSKSTSLIALLGKGPDEFQIIGADKRPFSEATIVSQLAL